MRHVCVAVVLLATVHGASAGDDASGPTPYSVDLSRPFTTYSMTQKDKLWGDSLVTKLKYKAILKLNTKWAYNPGVGGFSMHAPKSRHFIVCLNLGGGVPFLSSSPVKKGDVTWNGHDDWNRFDWPQRVD